MIKWAIKYWAQITSICILLAAIFSYCLRLAAKIENNVDRQNQVEMRIDTLEKSADDQDAELDNHDHRILRLETIEEMREKGICKQ